MIKVPLIYEIGDIVANPFGHVMAIGRIREDGKLLCFYQTNPGSYSLFDESEVRLLSKTKGVEVDGSQFMELIRICCERRMTVTRRPVEDEETKLLRSLSKEELQTLLKKLREKKSGEGISKIEIFSPKKECDPFLLDEKEREEET